MCWWVMLQRFGNVDDHPHIIVLDQSTCKNNYTMQGLLTWVAQVLRACRLTTCLFLQTGCGRTVRQLTMTEATLKKWIMEGGRLAAIPQVTQARAVARSTPETEPLSCRLRPMRSTSMQVFAQFTWLFLYFSPEGPHGQMLFGLLSYPVEN